VFVAGVVLLFRGRYPVPLYDFVLGMDRWALRVAAYVLLLTDAYPPFRLDMGGTDPGSVPVPPLPAGPPPAGSAAPPAAPAPFPPAAATPPPVPSRWTAGRVTSVVVGSVLLFAATGPLLAGGALLWADRTERDADGVLLASAGSVDTARYAVTTDGMVFEGDGLDRVVDELIGTARLEVTAEDPDDEVFVGVAPTAAVDRYLSGVGHATADTIDAGWGDPGDRPWQLEDAPGGAPAVPPTEAGIWTVAASGAGTQVLDWRPGEGNWTVVVMRADGDAGVAADVRAGATLPGLTAFAVALLVTGAVLLAVGGLLVALAVHRAQPPAGSVPATGPFPPGPRGAEPELTSPRGSRA
ncbi:MAG TPA: DUF4389 domain-containing protein, partial [Geodermatophilus sp.]|nr:DUF4389 domain-containing protein [Geodermatophilus sp.]